LRFPYGSTTANCSRACHSKVHALAEGDKVTDGWSAAAVRVLPEMSIAEARPLRAVA
jgi:hypothetical protein